MSVRTAGQASRPKKQKTTIRPLTARADQETATKWVRKALRQRQFRFYEADQVYPNHVWHQDKSGRIWFGRCLNSVQGHYKGWPIDEEERRAIFG